MKPPNITMPPLNTTQKSITTPTQQQQQQPASTETTTSSAPTTIPLLAANTVGAPIATTTSPNATTTPTSATTATTSSTAKIIPASTTSPSEPSILNSQTIITTKLQPLLATQIQQVPLALTTQPPKSSNQANLNNSRSPTTQANAVSCSAQSQLPQINTKLQSTIHATSTTTINTTQSAQPITLATATTTTGPTALVIIPQHSTTTSVAKGSTNKPSGSIPNIMGVTTTHVALATTTTQNSQIALQTPITTHVSGMTPITAHQQPTTTIVQPTIVSRPTTVLPVMPISSVPAIKNEPNKYICCLLDNGVRCDRVAGNASFSARIQKIVGTKKMNYALDPTVRHAYICEHHKAIITLAKKSTPVARDTKANARNYAANSNANTLPTQPNSNFNDLRQPTQQQLQHPINLELMTNQGRQANNHNSIINNSVPMRQGTPVAYGHYQGAVPNQMPSMDVMITPSNFDNTGGDTGASSSSRGVDVDLQQLQVNTLRRYKRHFRVQTRPGLNKTQLAESLKSHFKTLPIIEKEAITYFVYIVKCYRNKLDHNPKAD